jgi:hypothetical protein
MKPKTNKGKKSFNDDDYWDEDVNYDEDDDWDTDDEDWEDFTEDID